MTMTIVLLRAMLTQQSIRMLGTAAPELLTPSVVASTSVRDQMFGTRTFTIDVILISAIAITPITFLVVGSIVMLMASFIIAFFAK
jgi:hypothetical protein